MSESMTVEQKMARSIETWRKCDPILMASQSQAALTFAFRDMKRDILVLADGLNAQMANSRFHEANHCAAEKEIEALQARVAELEHNAAEHQRLKLELSKAMGHDAVNPSMCDLVAVAGMIAKERDELRLRVAELERYQVQSIANRICGEIPERFHIEMVLENGAGWVSLFHDGKPVDIDMADWNIAEQFDVAMQCVTEYANQIEGGA